MPKYFEGAQKLPQDLVVIDYNNGALDRIEQVLNHSTGRFCISVKLPGLPENSLGYLFIVDKTNDLYTVLDVKDVVHFKNVNSMYLARVIKHASGIEFDLEIQSDFHRIRNEIGLD
ncbi:MAG: hypothetical protein AB4372_22470 [Xenococcus sp. (in: cyanobacteria)]